MADFYGLSHSAFMLWWENLTKTDTSKEQVTTSTTKSQLQMVIVEPDSYEVIDFQFVPDVLSWQRNIDISEIKPILRNTPKYQYSGGSTVISFRLDFFANTDGRDDVIDRCRQIEALGYSDGYVKPKAQVKLVWGALFRNEVWEVLSVKYDLMEFKPDQYFLPQQAYVDITLGLVADTNLRINDVL